MSVGRHPHESEGFDDAALASSSSSSSTRRRARSARPASTTSATTPPARTSAARSSRRWSWRGALGRPLVVHTREAAEDTLDLLGRARATGVPVIIHCFSLADRVERVHRARLLLLVRRQRHLSQGDRPAARRRRACPDELLLAETDAPFLSPQERRGKPNEPAFVTADRRGSWPSCAAPPYEAMERSLGANAARLFGW